MRIAFICPYPFGEAPSQRFRFEQYLALLDEKSITYKQFSFLNSKGWRVIYAHGKTPHKIYFLLVGYLRRFLHLFQLFGFNYVFIHREASPLGPPIFEWLIARILRKRIIFDFDDAIWIPNTSAQNKLAAFAKNHDKFHQICRWSYRISAGNDFLVAYASAFCTDVQLNPTTIDTENVHNPALFHKDNKEPLVIGWTGTHSTLIYLQSIANTLELLSEKFEFELHIIANEIPDFHLPKMKFIKWTKASEIADLNRLDIGLMPLTADQWSEGKCGFKALQYMALEIPTIASPVGVNKIIIEHGKNGLLAEDENEWFTHLSALISNESLRKEIGKAGRKKVLSHYSTLSNRANFISLFQ